MAKTVVEYRKLSLLGFRRVVNLQELSTDRLKETPPRRLVEQNTDVTINVVYFSLSPLTLNARSYQLCSDDSGRRHWTFSSGNVFSFIEKNANHYNLYKRILEDRTANLVGPVRLDPFSACRASGIV